LDLEGRREGEREREKEGREIVTRCGGGYINDALEGLTERAYEGGEGERERRAF